MNTHIPTAHEVETFSGSYVDTRDPDPATITLGDIAHALANTCRYGGHCRRFYSVAEHAVFCSHRVERRGYALDFIMAALHHDDAEAYLGDIPRPMKPLLGTAYTELTNTMDQAVIVALGLPFTIHRFHSVPVKEADDWALLVEARFLLPSQGRTWTSIAPGLNNQPGRVVTPDYWRNGLEPADAEDLFLARHEELTA